MYVRMLSSYSKEKPPVLLVVLFYSESINSWMTLFAVEKS